MRSFEGGVAVVVTGVFLLLHSLDSISSRCGLRVGIEVDVGGVSAFSLGDDKDVFTIRFASFASELDTLHTGCQGYCAGFFGNSDDR